MQKNIYSGEKIYLNKISMRKIVKYCNFPLSLREKKVLELAAQGYNNPTIARKLYVNRHTVKAHMASALRKLSATNRTNAVYIALKSNIIK